MELDNLLVLMIAKACHEVNKVYCESIGDNSQVSWNDAPQWQKDSAMSGVRYHLHYPDSTPEDSHNSWLKEKTENGWSYGPVKDPDKKQHPCYLPYSQLPKEQQLKDSFFVAIVKSFI